MVTLSLTWNWHNMRPRTEACGSLSTGYGALAEADGTLSGALHVGKRVSLHQMHLASLCWTIVGALICLCLVLWIVIDWHWLMQALRV